MAVRVTEKSRMLIELPMMMFLRLADGDGKMTAREMECFDKLLKSRDWCRSSHFRRSLATTEAEKAEVWVRYTAGEFRTAIDQVAASLDTVLGSIAPEERPDFAEKATGAFFATLDWLADIGKDNTQQAREWLSILQR